MKSLLHKAEQLSRGSRRVPLGTVQFVGSVAAASVKYVAVGEHRGGVTGAHTAHAARRGPGASSCVVEFGASKGYLGS